ncbi:MAG: hypothetical protein HRT61_08995 [Ekhidna sp.]|nr:hypothetical protein [Ekhidna sp.]
MKNVADFLYLLDGSQRAIVSFLHQKLSDEYDLEAKIKWRIPTYHRRSIVCYLNPIKNDGIELAFPKGSLLSNSQGLLHRKGRKQVAGIDIYDLHFLSKIPMHELINEAIILDDFTPK